jgi:4-hydroxy-tetrahydrodipicolinate synthase
VSPAPVVYAAVPTMFGQDGELDPQANLALYKLVDGLLDGLLVAGTTGEFPALDDTERLALFELALAQAGPDRVIAHIGAPDARHATRLARSAVALGATRLAAITPYYLAARPDELIAYYSQIRAAVPGTELYAYIFPERTALPVPPALFARVAQAAGLAGAKISGSAAAELAGYVEAAPGLAIFSGNDANPAATMRAGGAGVISGRSSAYPEVYAALRAGAASGGAASGEGASGGAASGEGAQETLDRIVAMGASIGRLKYALRLRGLGTGVARMTVDPPEPETAAAIAEQVAACLRYA